MGQSTFTNVHNICFYLQHITWLHYSLTLFLMYIKYFKRLYPSKMSWNIHRRMPQPDPELFQYCRPVLFPGKV